MCIPLPRARVLRTVCFLDTFMLSCLCSSIQQQEVKPNGEEEKNRQGRARWAVLMSAHILQILPPKPIPYFFLSAAAQATQRESVRETDLMYVALLHLALSPSEDVVTGRAKEGAPGGDTGPHSTPHTPRPPSLHFLLSGRRKQTRILRAKCEH